ncbi:MAG: arginyltransferase [Pseudomonadota bacterium]
MTEQHKNFPEFYVTAAQSCPYLPGRRERKLFTHLTHEKPPALIDTLLKGGFRRSQNIAYMPYCDGCQACISVRVVVDQFETSRSFRRIQARNADVVTRRLPAQPTAEQYALFRSYIDARHGDGGMADMSVLDFAMMVEDSIIDTHLVEYRLRDPDSDDASSSSDGRLVGVALCDRLSDGISMVYSFYDPDLESRSLGTFMILEHLAATRAQGLPYLYLGYWIDGSRKMSYKTRFRPQEHLGPNGWERVSTPESE